MKKAYVASALANCELVLDIEKELRRKGLAISYSWASDYQLEHITGPRPRQEQGMLCLNGVIGADVFLLVLPGRRGAHVEYGIALGACIPTVVWRGDLEDVISLHQVPCTELVRTREEAIQAVLTASEQERC